MLWDFKLFYRSSSIPEMKRHVLRPNSRFPKFVMKSSRRVLNDNGNRCKLMIKKHSTIKSLLKLWLREKVNAKVMALSVSSFLVSSQRRNQKKFFYSHGKCFAKENFRIPAWASAKYYRGHQTGNPDQPVLLYLARSRSLPYNNEFYYADEIDENVNTENCDIDKQEQASEKTEKQQPIRG